jgi:hypothetical protein
VVVAGITTKKTDAPFTVHVGAAEPSMPSSSSGDGGASSSSGGGMATTSSSGGCTTASSAASRDGRHGDGLASLGVLGVAVAALVAGRRRRR